MWSTIDKRKAITPHLNFVTSDGKKICFNDTIDMIHPQFNYFSNERELVTLINIKINIYTSSLFYVDRTRVIIQIL